MEGTQAMDLEAGMETEILEGCFLLTCKPWFAKPDILYHLKPPTHEWYHSQVGGPSINH